MNRTTDLTAAFKALHQDIENNKYASAEMKQLLSQYVYKVQAEVLSAPAAYHTELYHRAHHAAINAAFFTANAAQLYWCAECGAPECANYTEPTRTQMRAAHRCFSCQLWADRAERLRVKPEGNTYIIDHQLYTDAGSKPNEPFYRESLGFGGRVFTVKRKRDNSTFQTNNMWYGGTLPPKYWDEFPDTAEFVK